TRHTRSTQEVVVRTRTIFVLASIIALSASPALAVGSHQLGLDVGASVPSHGFGDAASTGFTVGGTYQYSISRFGVGGDVKYNAWSALSAMKAEVLAADGAGSEVKYSAMQYDAFGIVTLPIATIPMLSPYAKVGMGWYAPESKLTTASGETKTS